jgi:transglutaminase-like putative cysteine protease
VIRIGGSRERTDSGKTGFLDPAILSRPVTAGVLEIARSVADSSAPAEGVVRSLVGWVRESIRREPAEDAPLRPARVLAERRAGAEGMVALFVDLARARGLTVRPVSGVLIAGDRGYGHVWAEVLLEGAWMAVDPTFGQVPASASLVRATLGGSSRAIDLVPVLGGASFTAADRSRDPR